MSIFRKNLSSADKKALDDYTAIMRGLDAKDATIASLREANKALTAENEALKHDIARHVQISSDEATRTDRISAGLAEARKDCNHYRERFLLAWEALTPANEDEKRGMQRVLAILENKQRSGTGPVRGTFGEKWLGRCQAFEECAEMLRLALASKEASR